MLTPKLVAVLFALQNVLTPIAFAAPPADKAPTPVARPEDKEAAAPWPCLEAEKHEELLKYYKMRPQPKAVIDKINEQYMSGEESCSKMKDATFLADLRAMVKTEAAVKQPECLSGKCPSPRASNPADLRAAVQRERVEPPEPPEPPPPRQPPPPREPPPAREPIYEIDPGPPPPSRRSHRERQDYDSDDSGTGFNKNSLMWGVGGALLGGILGYMIGKNSANNGPFGQQGYPPFGAPGFGQVPPFGQPQMPWGGPQFRPPGPLMGGPFGRGPLGGSPFGGGPFGGGPNFRSPFGYGGSGLMNNAPTMISPVGGGGYGGGYPTGYGYGGVGLGSGSYTGGYGGGYGYGGYGGYGGSIGGYGGFGGTPPTMISPTPFR